MRARAMESGQLSAAVAAIKEKGVLSGQRIERREIGAPGEFDALSDDELERAVRERFNALGLTPDAGSDRLKLIDGLWGLARQAHQIIENSPIAGNRPAKGAFSD